MTNLEVIFNRTNNTFTITNTSGGNVTSNIYFLDENDVFILSSTLTLGTGDSENFIVSEDNFYKFEDVGEAEYVIMFADAATTICLNTVANAIICGDFNCETITSFNSIVMTSQLLYNSIDNTFINSLTLTTLGASEISVLHTAKKLITRLSKYCATLDDCGC